MGITLKAKQNIIRLSSTESQVLPIVFSVNTKNMQEDNGTVGIDLVIVIDNSGSMSGEKIELVKQTLKFIVDIMKPNDRMCLISFESAGNRLTPLILVKK